METYPELPIQELPKPTDQYRYSSLDQYTIVRKSIGKGTTANLKLGYEETNRHHVALKIFRSKWRGQHAVKEAEVLSAC